MKGSMRTMAMVVHHTVHLMEVILIATMDTVAIMVAIMAIMVIVAMGAMGGMDTTEMDRDIMDQKWIMDLNTEMETRFTSNLRDGPVIIVVLLPLEPSRKHAPTRKPVPVAME
jgi:hypothetical protein